VQIVEESHEDFAEGTVIRTDPAVEARTGSTVTMYVSLGDVAVVPNVFRHQHDEAVDELEEAGLTVGDVTPVSCKRIRESNQDFDCSDFPDGGVVYGSLDWGATVPAGARMDIAYYDEDL
jgi:beta-lactam-binding protein with PASTA domain